MNKLTVFFEEPFWVGVFERIENGRLETAQVIFGREPKDYEVYDWVLRYYFRLRYGPLVDVKVRDLTSVSPKRLQRMARDTMRPAGVGTKAQQAMKLAQEQQRLARREGIKARRAEEKAQRFALRVEKKKQKQRGH